MKKFNQLTEKQMTKTNGGILVVPAIGAVVAGLVLAGGVAGGLIPQKQSKV